MLYLFYTESYRSLCRQSHFTKPKLGRVNVSPVSVKNLLLMKVLEIIFLISEIQGMYENFCVSIHLLEETNWVL